MPVTLRSRCLVLACFVLLLDSGLAWPDEKSKEADKKTLVVCAVPTAMPRTSRGPDEEAIGLDVAVVQLIDEPLRIRVERSVPLKGVVARGPGAIDDHRTHRDVVVGVAIDQGQDAL